MAIEPTPRLIHQYQLLRRIEGGSMGEVWRAQDTKLQRVVALKFLKAHHQLSADFVERFRDEAQVVARMRHDNIVTLHDYYVTDRSEYPQCYMVMSFIEGSTLQEYLHTTSHRHQLPAPQDIIYLFSALALALDYAHQQGIVHRDIKPSNIMLDQQQRVAGHAFGKPVITDFGIARAIGEEITNIEGTPFYVAPEQVAVHQQTVDGRSDLYSLGIILYEMFTGAPPFQGTTPLAIMLQHLHTAPALPELLNPQHVTPEISHVILTAIAKRPEDRYRTCSEMVIALAAALKQPVPRALLPQAERSDHTLITVLPLSLSQDERVADASSQGQDYSPSTAPAQPALPPTPPGQRSSWSRHRLILVGVVVILLCVVGVLYVPSLLNRGNTQTSMATVGTIRFTQTNGSQGYSTIQIDLTHVPPAPAGKTYYGWVKPEGREVQAANWPLQVKDGQIHSGPLTFAGTPNLLLPNSLFIVSLESSGGSPPPVPNQDLSQRLFYARVQTTNATTFSVRTCPTDLSARTCL
jgi:Serine/threonine protein kinase